MKDTTAKKIKSIGELAKISAKLKERGKKIVHCHGVYDLVHPGHIRHLKSAKKHGDILIVTLTKDKHVKRGPGRPIFNEHLRAETLASLEITDYVTSLDFSTAIEAIRAIKPTFYVKGKDYQDRKKDVTGKIYDEEDTVKKYGGKIIFTDDITFSSSHLINQHLDVYPKKTIKYLKELSKKFALTTVFDYFKNVQTKKILVIGDAIIDQYHYCTPMNKSTKEPIVVNKYVSEESFAGGVLATANHVAQLSKKVTLCSVLGSNKTFESLINKKMNKLTKTKFILRPNTSTTVKCRFVGEETKQKFFEVCYMDDSPLERDIETRLHDYLKKNIKSFDAVIVNDFGHGMLTPKIIKTLCSQSKFLALNVQSNSANLGFNMITKYRRADYVCIDELEMRLALHDKTSDIRVLLKQAHKALGCKTISVTRGQHGALSYTKKMGFVESPALSNLIVDKVGAGDAFFAFTAPCVATGMPEDLALFIGNAVGSLAVQIIGNREPVKLVDLNKFITRLLKF
jgi:rfaE bifunctional protein kinase chain/domain/rfaE bifunctional protein nucleotidyltransferase chain/domain